MQNHVGQQFGSHGNFSVVVVDQAQCSELVHKVCDTGPRGPNHFRQSLVTHPRHFGGRRGIVLAETAEFQQDTGQPFLAMVEKLIAKILFHVDVADQQYRSEFLRKVGLA